MCRGCALAPALHGSPLNRRDAPLCALQCVCFSLSFTLEQRDFTSLKEYNDYLEQSADIIYQLTYGTKSDAAAARQRLVEFARVNRAAIDRSKSRRFQEERDAERRERRANMSAEERAAFAAAQQQQQQVQLGGGAGGMSFTLPQPDESGSAPPSSLEEEKRLRQSSDRKGLWQLEELRRIAGGFKREDDMKRSRQDAMDGLWF